jgi:hypothetical protein
MAGQRAVGLKQALSHPLYHGKKGSTAVLVQMATTLGRASAERFTDNCDLSFFNRCFRFAFHVQYPGSSRYASRCEGHRPDPLRPPRRLTEVSCQTTN